MFDSPYTRFKSSLCHVLRIQFIYFSSFSSTMIPRTKLALGHSILLLSSSHQGRITCVMLSNDNLLLSMLVASPWYLVGSISTSPPHETRPWNIKQEFFYFCIMSILTWASELRHKTWNAHDLVHRLGFFSILFGWVDPQKRRDKNWFMDMVDKLLMMTFKNVYAI